MELLQPGMELLTNSDLTEVTVEGDNRTNLETLVRKVGYVNTREFPTAGRRNIRLTTTVTCDNGKTVRVSVFIESCTVGYNISIVVQFCWILDGSKGL